MSQTTLKHRIELANDILIYLKEGVFDVISNQYIKFGSQISNREIRENVTLKYLLKKNTCKVCALGAFLAAKALCDNNICVNDLELNHYEDSVFRRWQINSHLLEIFPQDQIDMIELAYEGHQYNRNDLPALLYQFALKFYADHVDKSPRDRMIAIMENIIKNNGTFKP